MFRHIRWKLLAFCMVVCTPPFIFIGVHLSQQFEAIFTTQLKAGLLDLARLIAPEALEGLSSGDPAAVRRHLRGGHHGADGPQVVITDASGTIVGVRGVPESAVGTRYAHPSIARALQGEEVAGVGTAPGADEAAFAAVPVRAGPGSRVFGVAHVSQPLSALRAELQHIRWVVAGTVLAALLIAVPLWLLLAQTIAGPVQEMERVASKLADGRLSERVPVRSRDELGELARSLNYMASELEHIDAMRRAFIADASHELRTPVANLAVAVEALKAVIGRDPDQANAVAADLEREVQRLAELVENLLDLSLAESGQVRLNLTALSPSELVLRAAHPFQVRAAHAGITLSTEIPSRLSRVTVDADRTVQVLTNLLENALKVTPPGGRITVEASEQHEHILFSVTDTGPGIPEAELPHIFDRFYRVDKARTRGRGGAGLGLAIAKRLVEAQGGIIKAESKERRGARFVVALPKAS